MWLEYLKNYDISVLYNPGKANVVADVLCRMTTGSVSHLEEPNKDLVKDVHRLALLVFECKILLMVVCGA